jgi:hypothetical protein
MNDEQINSDGMLHTDEVTDDCIAIRAVIFQTYCFNVNVYDSNNIVESHFTMIINYRIFASQSVATSSSILWHRVFSGHYTGDAQHAMSNRASRQVDIVGDCHV